MRTRLAALAAIVGLALAGSAGAVRAGDVESSEMTLALTAFDGVGIEETGEDVTYFGTLDFGEGDVYAIAFYSDAPPAPLFGDWVGGSDRWEVYDDEETIDEATAVIAGAALTAVPDGDVVAASVDRFVGNFERNVFYGFGPGGAWKGSFTTFLDPPPNAPPDTPPIPDVFEGPFWLFGELDD